MLPVLKLAILFKSQARVSNDVFGAVNPTDCSLHEEMLVFAGHLPPVTHFLYQGMGQKEELVYPCTPQHHKGFYQVSLSLELFIHSYHDVFGS